MITQIKVENFKCFENESLQLSNLNLFSGINSMGKSTMIQSLLLLRQSFEQDSFDRGIYLNGKYTNLGVGRDLFYTEARGSSIGITLQDSEDEIKRIYRYEKDADFLELSEEMDLVQQKEAIQNLNLFGKGFSYVSADRLGPQSSYQKSYYVVREYEQLGNHGEYALHYLREHELDYVENEAVLYDGEKSTRLYQQVESWMGEITPGISLRIEEYGHSNLIGLTVHQQSSIASDYFSAQNVGFGISYVLPVVLALVKAKPGELVILENPEAHLHPKGQRRIGELIARAAQGGVQIIVETHSDHILNGIRISAKNGKLDADKVRLFFFSRENSGGRVIPVIEKPELKEDGRLSFWPEDFFDEWDKAIDEMF